MKKYKFILVICVVFMILLCIFMVIHYNCIQNKGLQKNEILRFVTSNGAIGIGGSDTVYYVLYKDGTLSAEWGTPKGQYSAYVLKDGEMKPKLGLITKLGFIKSREYCDEDLRRTPYMKNVWKKKSVLLSQEEFSKIIELADEVYESDLPEEFVKATDSIYYQILYKDKLSKQYYSEQLNELKAFADEINKLIPMEFKGLA